MTTPASATVDRMLDAMIGDEARPTVAWTGTGSLPSVFPVTEFASASIGAAGTALSGLIALHGRPAPAVTVDRRLASLWFAGSLRPEGWAPPPPWDPVAGDYRTADGWIRLHTNADAHRRAALGVLDVPADRERVGAAVAAWQATDLETAVVEAGGCAAAMRTINEWDAGEPGVAVAEEPLVAWALTGASRRPDPRPTPGRPLAGVRVLDLTRVLAGPVATRFLAQLGAEVLRIDPPWWDEPGVLPEVMLGKRSSRLDLRDADARSRLLDLLADADVLVHGYRPGALDGLGLGEDVRRSVAPGLVEVTLDAYGWTGPWAGRRGFDSLVQMSTGIADAGMRRLGRDVPTPLPVQALDHATGYLMAAAAIRAFTERLRSGRGARAALSLARTARLLVGSAVAADGADPEPVSPARSDDLSSSLEQTTWGPARRVRMPLQLDGVDFSVDLPARDLGGDEPAWANAAKA